MGRQPRGPQALAAGSRSHRCAVAGQWADRWLAARRSGMWSVAWLLQRPMASEGLEEARETVRVGVRTRSTCCGAMLIAEDEHKRLRYRGWGLDGPA